MFTRVNLKDGYWHVKLTEELSYLTTFATLMEDTDTTGFHLVYMCHRTFASLKSTKHVVIVKELFVSQMTSYIMEKEI